MEINQESVHKIKKINENLNEESIQDSVNKYDIWEDAQEFLKSQLPIDFEDHLEKYVVDKGYNKNEFKLFKHKLEEAVGLYGTIILLKHYC